MQKLVIVGTGISGLSAAHFLKNRFACQLFEKAEQPGGLIKCDTVEGNLFHKVGGHVFNARNKEVFDWFWSFFDQENEFIKTRRNAKIWMNGRLLGYPIENHLADFDRTTVTNIFEELLALQKTEKKNPFEYAHFEDFLKNNFGETLYALYFKPYNQKIWNTDLSKVALEWLEGKLPMPNLLQIIMSNILKGEESQMVHSTFYYPRQSGSQFIANRLSHGLNIQYDNPVESIECVRAGGLVVNGNTPCDKLVYTGDVRKLHQVVKTDSFQLKEAMESVVGLKSNGTSNVLCTTDDTDLSWLYIPETFTKAHRIIYTGNFSADNNQAGGRKTCVAEFSGKVEPELMREEIKKLPGNLEYVAHNYEPNSYVVQAHGSKQKVEHLKALLQKKGIYLLGRFAEWEYYNMDKAIEAAMLLGKKLSD
jgi:protoporphyrinogen oxidase